MKNMLPIRMSLQKRGVFDATSSTACLMCMEGEETISHLFCSTANKVWTALYRWTCTIITPHINPIEHFLQHADMLGDRDKTEMASSLWVGTMWSIWTMRNNLIFNNENPNVDKLLEKSKLRCGHGN